MVSQPDRLELQPASPHPLFCIGDADQAHPVAALGQRMAQGDHPVEMAAGSGTEQAELGHGNGLGRLEYLDFLCGTPDRSRLKRDLSLFVRAPSEGDECSFQQVRKKRQ